MQNTTQTVKKILIDSTVHIKRSCYWQTEYSTLKNPSTNRKVSIMQILYQKQGLSLILFCKHFFMSNQGLIIDGSTVSIPLLIWWETRQGIDVLPFHSHWSTQALSEQKIINPIPNWKQSHKTVFISYQKPEHQLLHNQRQCLKGTVSREVFLRPEKF